MSKSVWFMLVSIVLLLVAVGAIPAAAASSDIELWKKAPASRSGVINFYGTTSIGGVVFEGGFSGGGAKGNGRGFVIWRVPKGYAVFECRCGIPDSSPYDDPGEFEFLVDGDSVKEFQTDKNEKPVTVRIPVRGGQSVRVTFSGGIVAEPKFTKERAVAYKCSACGKVFASQIALDKHVKVAHSRKPFVCPVCRVDFHTQQGFDKHIADLHAAAARANKTD